MNNCESIASVSLISGIGILYALNCAFLGKDRKGSLKGIRRKQRLRFQSDTTTYEEVCDYIMDQYKEQIDEFTFTDDLITNCGEWGRRKKSNNQVRSFGILKGELTVPLSLDERQYKIDISIKPIRDKSQEIRKIMCDKGAYIPVEDFVSEIYLTCDSKDPLIEFVDRASQYSKNKIKQALQSSSETMCTYYFKNEYWSLLSKVPKRPLSTIYLKKGVKESIFEKANEFFSEDMRDSYIKYGIPYKYVCMIYGPPGTGKTSIIKGIASELDCDLYILPITKMMKDSDFVDAFNYINDTSEKKRVIVIEDIDTLFDDRKEGDTNTMITMQSLLNCLDGFTCVEGTMLYITANKPETLDDAMIRSCRIDHRVEITYADKYQTQTMFDVFFPNDKDAFQDFYKTFQHKKYTTAMLQEFLFYNRDCENIMDIRDKFQEVIDKNASKNYEVVKGNEQSLYM